MRTHQHIHGTHSRNLDGISHTYYQEKFIEAYGRRVLAVEHETSMYIKRKGNVIIGYDTIVPGFIARHGSDISQVVGIPRNYRKYTRYLLKRAGLRGPITFQ
jgi:hypothetical protein